MSPLLDELAEAEREAAVARGRDSLTDRGYLVGGAPAEDLATIVRFRTEARVVAIADLADGSRYLYGIGDAVLDETVAGSEHRFVLRTVASAAEALADAADPSSRADEDGPLLHRADDEQADGWEELERAVAAAESVLQLYVASRATEETVQEFSASFAAGPDGVWLVSGHADPDTGAQELWGRRLGRASLEAAFAALLAGPVAEPA